MYLHVRVFTLPSKQTLGGWDNIGHEGPEGTISSLRPNVCFEGLSGNRLFRVASFTTVCMYTLYVRLKSTFLCNHYSMYFLGKQGLSFPRPYGEIEKSCYIVCLVELARTQ